VGIEKPFHRNYRVGHSGWNYIFDKKYAVNPANYTKTFMIILNELKELFEFIEPYDRNLDTCSSKIHQLMTKTCIEVEANFKAILRENTFNPKDNNGKIREENWWDINDFKIVNKTHHLDAYQIGIPVWSGSENKITPFLDWGNGKDLYWYEAYNKIKPDKAKNSKEASLRNLLGAVTGLLVLLSSQFRTESSFSFISKKVRKFEIPIISSVVTIKKFAIPVISLGKDSYREEEFGIGNYFTVKFPDDWTDDEKYDFNWTELEKEEDRFKKIDYDKIQKEYNKTSHNNK